MEKERNMSTHITVEGAPLEEYWQEFISIQEIGHPDEDEDEASKTPDEGEAEEEWLREAGFETLVNNEEPEDQLFNEILSTLTTRQREVVLKKLQTLEMSKKKKKHKNRQRADVREVFNCHSCKDTLMSLESDTSEHTSLITSAHKDGPDLIGSDTTRDRPVVFRGMVQNEQEEQPKNSKSSSVLPVFLRTGHSGGFSLREHSKGIDTESPTSVEVLRYETRTSVIQEKEPFPDANGKEKGYSENNEISFQGIASRLNPAEDTVDGMSNDVVDSMWKRHVPVSELGEDDRAQVRSLSVIEVAALFDSHGLVPRRRRKANRKKGKENALCGSSLSTLLELDRRRCPGLKIPLIYQWILHHLHEKGLEEEGLMRLAGSVQKIEALKAECERHYVSSPMQVENSIRQSSVYDVAVLLKQLVRQLSEPLLTYSHMDTFLQVPNIPTARDQICALNLLVLALPDVHRELLQELLHFLAKVVDNQESNRMSLSNVAMIMAPNLFPPPRLKKSHHKSNDLEAEITVAALSSKVTQLLIKHCHFLGMVPKQLLAQARLQSHYSLKKQAKRSRGRKTKTDKLNVIKEAVMSTNGHASVIRVHLPSLHYLNTVPVTVDERTTAKEVILKVARVMDLLTDPSGQLYPEQQENKAVFFQRPRTESEPIYMYQKCLLGAKNSTDCLRGHSLYYIAENIGERKLEHEDFVLGIWSGGGSRPSSWKICCHH